MAGDRHDPQPRGRDQAPQARARRGPDRALPVRVRGEACRGAPPPQRGGRLRRRRDADRVRSDATVPGDGAGRPQAALRAAPRRPPPGPGGRTRPARSGRRRPGRRTPRRHRPPRREARQPPGHPAAQGEGDRLRHRPSAGVDRHHRDRPGHGHAAIPEPRAGPWREGHPGLRRLLPRRGRLRVPGRLPAVPEGDPGRDRNRPPPRPGPAAARPRPRRSGRGRDEEPAEGPHPPLRRRGRVHHRDDRARRCRRGRRCDHRRRRRAG